jgi:hypothetical protein
MNLSLHNWISSAGNDEHILICTFLVAISASDELNLVPNGSALCTSLYLASLTPSGFNDRLKQFSASSKTCENLQVLQLSS